MKTGHSDTFKFVFHCGVGCIGIKHGQDDRMTKDVILLSLSLFLCHTLGTFLVTFFPIQPSDTFGSLPSQSIDHRVFVFNLSVSLSLYVSHHSLILLVNCSRPLNLPVSLALHVLVSMYRPNLIRQDGLEREGVRRSV